MKTNVPLVSVVIPVFNRPTTIKRAITSVINQTYSNIEIIIVDDGSTDATPEILTKYAQYVTVIRQKNSGPSIARNTGIDASRGDYVAFLDSDDEWKTTKIQRQIEAFAKAGGNVSCCLTNTVMHYPRKEESILSFDLAPFNFHFSEGIWENPFQVLVTRHVLFIQAVMVRRDVLIDSGKFHQDLWLMEDHHLALRLALAGPWVYIQDPLVEYFEGIDGDSLSARAQTDRIFYLKNVIKLYEDILTNKKVEKKEKTYIKKYRLAAAHYDIKMLKNGSIFNRLLYKFFQRLRRIRVSLLRHTPFSPRVIDFPLPSPKKMEH